MVRAMVQSVKHITSHSLANIVAGNISGFTDILSVNVTAANLSTEVREGATVKAFWLELWITSDDATQSSFIMCVEKKNSTQTDMTAAEIAALFGYKNKKNILYTTQGLTNPKTGVAMPIYKGWVKIPKSKQRFGLGDQLRVNILAQSDGINFCGLTLYKEYF